MIKCIEILKNGLKGLGVQYYTVEMSKKSFKNQLKIINENDQNGTELGGDPLGHLRFNI